MIHADSTDQLFYSAVEQINNGNFEDALSYLDKILEINPNHQATLTNKGGVLIELGKNEDAIKYLDRALEINPDDVDTINNKAIALLRLGDFVASLNNSYDAFKIDPYNNVTISNIDYFIEKHREFSKTGYAHIALINAERQLIDYQYTENVYVLIPFGFRFLQDFAEVEQVTIDGKNYNKFEFSQINFIDKRFKMYPKTKLLMTGGDTTYSVIQIHHNGFVTDKGDSLYVYVQVLQEINEPRS